MRNAILVVALLFLGSNAWGGPGGKVRLCYNLPEYLKKRHGIEGKDEALDGLARTLGAIADKALE